MSDCQNIFYRQNRFNKMIFLVVTVNENDEHNIVCYLDDIDKAEDRRKSEQSQLDMWKGEYAYVKSVKQG